MCSLVAGVELVLPPQIGWYLATLFKLNLDLWNFKIQENAEKIQTITFFYCSVLKPKFVYKSGKRNISTSGIQMCALWYS